MTLGVLFRFKGLNLGYHFEGGNMHFQRRFTLGILWIGFFVPVTACLQACAAQSEQETRDVDAQAIEAVLNAQVKAWNEHRIEKFMDTYWKSDKLSFSSGGETTFGWQATLERYQSRYPDGQTMGHLRFDHLKVQRLGDLSAFVLGEWYLKRSDQEMRGNFTLVLRKIDGHWKIVHDHTSLKKEDS